MAFKLVEDILKPDVRFENLRIVEKGMARPLQLRDHYGAIARVVIGGTAPQEVVDAFDRAKTAFVYAYFNYDLLVTGQIQAFGAFELALKHRLNGHGGSSKGTLRNLVDRARKARVFPPKPPPGEELSDPIEVMIVMRNGLSHGTSDIHSPAMALSVLEACATAINKVYPS